MAVDDTAFFRFDTNLNEVVAEIEQGMARINRAATATPAGRVQQQSIDIGALSGFFGNVQQAATDLSTQMRDMIRQVGANQMTPATFREQSRDLLRNTMEGARRALAAEFVALPESTRRSLDFTEVMRGVVNDIYRTANSTLQTFRGDAQGRLAGVSLRAPNTFMEQLATRPLGATGDPISRLALVDFAEGLIRDTVGGKLTRSEADAIGQRLGLGTTQPRAGGLLRQVFNEVAILDPESGLPVGVRNRGTADELRRALGSEAGGARADAEYTRRMEAIAKAQNAAAVATYNHEQRVEALRLAQRAARGEFGDPLPSGAYMPNANRAYIPGAGGLVPGDANQTRKVREEVEKLTAAQEKQRIEAENYQRVLATGQRIGSSSTYVTPEGAFMRDLGDGRARQLVGLEATRAAEAYGRQLAQVEKQERSLVAHREREAHRAAASDGFLGGFLGRFHRGDQGIVASLGTQVASAAAFSFAYGSLFALQAAMRDTLNEVRDYQDSLTDLEVATVDADVVTNDWIHSLSEMSRLTGENIGASLDTAARGIRAFGDAAKQSEAEIQAVGSATNEAATMLALIANKPLADATGDIISVGTAFGLDPDQLDQITDAVANAKRSLGGDPAQIAQGLSLVAITAQEAGFSLNEAAAVMSLVQARTDQSGQAIATRLSRIFQIISGSTGKRLARELGVDPTASIKEQIESFAEIYSTGSPQVQDRISSALGGTANLRELLPLLQEQSRLQQAYASALNNSGQGTDEFNRKTENLVGQLKQVAGVISNIQVDLARSGIFAPLGIALEVLNPALQGLDRLLRFYIDIVDQAGPLKEILAITAEIFLAAKAIGTISAANAGFGLLAGRRGLKGGGIGADGTRLAVEMAALAQGVRLTGAQRAAAEQAFTASIVQAAGQRRAAEAAAAGSAATGGIRGGLTSLLGFAKSPAVLLGAAAIGGLAGIDYIKDVDDQSAQMQDRANSMLTAFSRIDGTSESIAQAVQDLNAAAGKLEKTDARFANQAQQERDVDFLHDNADYLRVLQLRVASEERHAAAMRETTVFGDGLIETVSELGRGLELLAADGANALTMAEELREALRTPPPPNGGVFFQPEATTSRVVTNVLGALAPAIQRAGAVGNRISILGGPDGDEFDRFGNVLWTPVRPNEAVGAAARLNDGRDIEQAVRQKMAELGLTAESGSINPKQYNALVEAAVAAMDTSIFTPRDAARIREEAIEIVTAQGLSAGQGYTAGEFITGGPFVDALRKKFNPSAEQRQSLLNGRGRLSQNDIMALFTTVNDETGQFTSIADQFQAELAAIPETDDGSQLRSVLKEQVKFGEFLRRRAGGELPEVVADFFAATDRQLRVAVDERLEQLRKVAQSAGGLSKKEIRAIGREFLARRLKNAQGDINLMIQIMESANQQALDMVRQTLVNALNLAKAAAAAQTTFFGQIAAVAQVAKSFAVLQQFDYARKQAVVGVDPNAGMLGGEGAAIYEPPKAEEDKKTAAEKAEEALEKRREAAALTAAKAQAAAARRGGSLASARAALTAAAASLRAEERGTAEWYQALGQWYDARRQMQDAVLQYRYTLSQLRGDITDPVENARDSLRNATRTLRAHRRSGAGRDVLAEDRLAVREERASLQNARFQQRLSDMQTAEELGRISFQKYINYLDNEHDRLTKIKNRTRQQQDHLDEIDRALKDAMQQYEGQFNLGDINMRGMVYRARRHLEQQRAQRQIERMTNQAVVNNNQDIRIQIDGADVAKVRRIIEQYVGGSVTVRAVQPRRRR